MSSESQPLLLGRYPTYTFDTTIDTVEQLLPVSFSRLRELVSQVGLKNLLCVVDSPDMFSNDTRDLCTTTPATTLKILELRFCQTENSLNCIEKFSNLTKLSIQNALIDLVSAQNIAKITTLQELCLSECIIEEKAIKALQTTSLTRFSTYNCTINIQSLVQALQFFSSCNHIRIETRLKNKVSIESLEAIFNTHPNLKVFCCMNEILDTGQKLVPALKKLDKLEKLSLNVTGLPEEIESEIQGIKEFTVLKLNRDKINPSLLSQVFSKLSFNQR